MSGEGDLQWRGNMMVFAPNHEIATSPGKKPLPDPLQKEREKYIACERFGKRGWVGKAIRNDVLLLACLAFPGK